MYDELIKRAYKAMKFSYSPYSGFKVGACLETTDGKFYSGCNIENASYTPTVCAERVAIFKAISDGSKNFKRIAIVSTSDFTYPCGVCRQVISEFSEDIEIVVSNSKFEYKVYHISDLLPFSFNSESMR